MPHICVHFDGGIVLELQLGYETRILTHKNNLTKFTSILQLHDHTIYFLLPGMVCRCLAAASVHFLWQLCFVMVEVVLQIQGADDPQIILNVCLLQLTLKTLIEQTKTKINLMQNISSLNKKMYKLFISPFNFKSGI